MISKRKILPRKKNMIASTAAAGTVRNHALKISRVTFMLIPAKPRANPIPRMAPINV